MRFLPGSAPAQLDLQRRHIDDDDLKIDLNGDRFNDHGLAIFIGDLAGHSPPARHRDINILEIIVLRYIQPLAGIVSPYDEMPLTERTQSPEIS